MAMCRCVPACRPRRRIAVVVLHCCDINGLLSTSFGRFLILPEILIFPLLKWSTPYPTVQVLSTVDSRVLNRVCRLLRSRSSMAAVHGQACFGEHCDIQVCVVGCCVTVGSVNNCLRIVSHTAHGHSPSCNLPVNMHPRSIHVDRFQVCTQPFQRPRD